MRQVAQMPSDAEKEQVWKAFRARRTTRTPVNLYTNPRVVLMNEAWNPEGVSFEQVMSDPKTHVEISLRHELHRRQVINRYCDSPTSPPEVWPVTLMIYNVYEAGYFGAPLRFDDGQLPDTQPPYVDESDREAIFEIDIERPLENPFIKRWLTFHAEMARVCKGLRFEGRPVKLLPWAQLATDGPVTVAMNLRGPAFMMDLACEPEYADRLMAYIIQAAVNRREAFKAYWGDAISDGWNGMADDSCALLSPAMFVDQVAPHHERFYRSGPTGVDRAMHMCGSAMHLYELVHRVLKVTSIDTGFPVEHGKLRRMLGPDVAIQGGPEVGLLLSGEPDAVYERTRGILLSGVLDGGRFTLREGNNLPPNVPEANLEAMYHACLEHGWVNRDGQPAG